MIEKHQPVGGCRVYGIPVVVGGQAEKWLNPLETEEWIGPCAGLAVAGDEQGTLKQDQGCYGDDGAESDENELLSQGGGWRDVLRIFTTTVPTM